jgi:penicillin-binding protein 1C
MDLVHRRRSTGSVLKPFLFASMIENGMLQPGTLVPDVPTHFQGFSPENYDQRFRGAVRARQALAHSLNVPSVYMLKRHGIARFHDLLEGMGMSTLHRTPQAYGLSLVIGGAEGTLWELTGMYANLARTLRRGAVAGEHRLAELQVRRDTDTEPGAPAPLGAGSAWLTLQSLLEVERPGIDAGWRDQVGSRRIAWKTGTSHGLRDGWAIGTTPRYTVGVWTGNAAGEGRSGLTGTTTAGPILFSIFEQLDTGGWFDKPKRRLKAIQVCRDDGLLPQQGCPTHRTTVPVDSHYHRMSDNYRRIHLGPESPHRVNADCESVAAMRTRSRFVLPPAQAHYYRQHNANYRPMPPMRRDCQPQEPADTFAILYPNPGTSVYIPETLGGQRGRVVLRAVHRAGKGRLHWHLDGELLATTETFHEVPVTLAPGEHKLTVVAANGARKTRQFRVTAPDEQRELSLH